MNVANRIFSSGGGKVSFVTLQANSGALNLQQWQQAQSVSSAQQINSAQVIESLNANEKIMQMLTAISDRLPVASAPYCIFVSTLAANDIDVVKPIPVTIEMESDDSFIASFVDAGISSGGPTRQDAVWSLQDRIAMLFATLSEMPSNKLGAKMQRKKAVLSEFVCQSSRKPMPKIPQKS
ncbi:MAG: hypothetical protein V4719_10790 [Planctomycetota bacterium]